VRHDLVAGFIRFEIELHAIAHGHVTNELMSVPRCTIVVSASWWTVYAVSA
jgi:hypothetical protein